MLTYVTGLSGLTIGLFYSLDISTALVATAAGYPTGPPPKLTAYPEKGTYVGGGGL